MNPGWETKSPDDSEERSPCAATADPVLWSLWAITRESVHLNKRSCMLQLRPNAAKPTNILSEVKYRKKIIIISSKSKKTGAK